MLRHIVILSAVTSLNCASPVAAMEVPSQHHLAPLSDKDMGATFGGSSQHSPWVKNNMGDLHANGDRWEDAKAQRFFCDGLFQHYFHQFSRFDYEHNYNQYLTDFPTDKHPDRECVRMNIADHMIIRDIFSTSQITIPKTRAGKGLLREEALNELLKICHWYKSVGDSLKSNPLFRCLGGKFQILKIQIEKKERELGKSSEDKKEMLVKAMLDLDRYCIDCQVILFHWIKDVCDKARDELILCYKNNQQADAIDAAIANKIGVMYPEFLYRPVYRDFMNTYAKDLLPGIGQPIIEPVVVVEIVRSADELKNILIANMEDTGDFEPLININPIVEIAKKAFGDDGSDEDLAAYNQLFQEQRPQFSGILQISEAEMMNFETILNALIIERANI